MSQTRRNRRQKSKMQGTIDTKIIKDLLNRNAELMCEVFELIRTDNAKGMPYRITGFTIEAPGIGMTLSISLIHFPVAESRYEEFIDSKIFNDEINLLIKKRIEMRIPINEPQFQLFTRREFIGMIMVEKEEDGTSLNESFLGIDFPIGPISMN
jgi:hypothetical protein